MGSDRLPFNFPRLVNRFAWAFYLAAALLLYSLGVAVAAYLGRAPGSGIFLLGLGWVYGLLLFTYFAYLYFDLRTAAANLGRQFFGFLPWRSGMMVGIVVSATLAASFTLMLVQLGVLTQEIWLLMLLAVAGAVLYALPPARWATSGYGELMVSVLLAAGIPALGFMLGFGGYHRFLAMIAFPLAALHLSMTIALSLPTYTTLQKYEIKTLLMRMGWENSMMAHNLLILSAFLLIVVASLFGFPRFAMLPSLLIFPLGGFQIWYMLRIADGARPNWNALTISAVSLFAIPVYIFMLAFWTR